MWGIVMMVKVWLRSQNRCVMGQTLTVGLVIVNDAHFLPVELEENNRSGITIADVPCGIHPQAFVPRYIAYPPLVFGPLNVLSIVGAFYAKGKAAVVLLLDHVL